MKKLYYCLCALLWMSFPLLAQVDTTTRQLTQIVVFGKKPEQFAAGSRITSIDNNYLHIQNSSSLASMLQARSPLYVKNYGNGMLASVSFRGTASRHTAVLWNGFNINLPSAGESDFALIPTNGHSTISIQHGGASANYGSGAIGGAILLSSPVNFNKSGQLNIQQDIGSYHHFYNNLSGSYSNGKISLQTQLYRNQTRNDFEYTIKEFSGTVRKKQENAAIKQYGFTQDVHIKLAPQSYLSFRGWYNQSDRQVQPTMIEKNDSSRQEDKNLRLMAEYTTSTGIGNLVIRTAFFNDILQYNISRSAIQTYQAQIEDNLFIGNKLSLKGGGEFQHFTASVDGYGRSITENRASAFALLRYDPLSRLHVSLNIRQGLVQGFNPPLAPTLGFGLNLLQQEKHLLTLKGNVSRSYRVPTLNERFWQPGGNPNIKAEDGWGYETGLQHLLTLPKMRLETEATYYRMLIDNWVQWQPAPAGYWSPRNIDQVLSQGFEFSTRLSYQFNALKVTTGCMYAYTKSTQKETITIAEKGKQLIYVPLHSASVYTDLTFKTWILGGNLSFTGLRYIEGGNTDWLPSYMLFNTWAGKIFTLNKTQFQLIAKVNNITNQVYQTMTFRAMPLRNYAVSLRFTIGKVKS